MLVGILSPLHPFRRRGLETESVEKGRYMRRVEGQVLGRWARRAEGQGLGFWAGQRSFRS